MPAAGERFAWWALRWKSASLDERCAWWALHLMSATLDEHYAQFLRFVWGALRLRDSFLRRTTLEAAGRSTNAALLERSAPQAQRSSRPQAAPQAKRSSSFYPLRSALDADDFALNQHFTETVAHGFESGIGRAQFDIILTQVEPLDGGLLAADECHHNFTVLGVLTWFADRQIAVQDSDIFHRMALDPQGKKILAAKDRGIQHRAAVPIRLGVHRQSGHDPADDGNLPPALSRRRLAGAV